MDKRNLGNLTVSEIGMGCMGFSHGYGEIPSEETSIEAIRAALSFLLALWLHMGVVGIALAMGIDWTVKAALDLARYRGGKWRSMQVI